MHYYSWALAFHTILKSDFFQSLHSFALMKIKTISRAKEDYVKEKDGDVDKIHRNIDPKYHPFQQQREVIVLKIDLK